MLVNGTDDLPRAVPAPEKLARRKRAAAKLQGLGLKGGLDISDRLLERFDLGAHRRLQARDELAS